jgi:phosphatidylserine/phosphatidylglycerophosphate/cardiolipin synthase-like enzyme
MSLEDAIAALIEIGVPLAIAEAVRDCRLTRSSSMAAIAAVFPGQPRAQHATSELLQSWGSDLPEATGVTIARFIECAANLLAHQQQRSGSTRLVWTGPDAPGSVPRSSRQIMKEIIISARREIWIAAYWIAGPRDGEGIVGDIVELLAAAVRQGLDVALALDGRPRTNGETNFDVLRTLWPPSTRLPRVYTWAEALHEPYLKLHAKTVVADRRDALVTSANLTMHALERSMELGVRLQGALANEIAAQLDGLVRSKVLTPVEMSNPQRPAQAR